MPHDDDGQVDQVHGKISATAEASDSNSDGGTEEAVVSDTIEETGARSLTEDVHVDGHDGSQDDSGVVESGRDPVERFVEEPEKIRIEVIADEGSVAKKRRRNDVSLAAGKSVLQGGSQQKDEGIRRFDAQIEPDDSEELGQRKILDDGIAEDIPHLQEDAVERQRGSIDVERSHVNVNNANRPSDEDGARSEGEKSSEISGGLDVKLEDVAAEKIDLNEGEVLQVKNSEVVNVDDPRIEKIDEVNEEVRNDLRSLELSDSSERNPEEHVVDETATKEETGVKDQEDRKSVV